MKPLTKTNGIGYGGWASTKPGQTKYHHYDAQGVSKCSYQRQPGPLHFHPDPKQLTPEECCSSCDLHILKAEQAAKRAAPNPKPVAAPLPSQLSLF